MARFGFDSDLKEPPVVAASPASASPSPATIRLQQGATGKARKWRNSASRGISALGAHIKRASGYGAAATAGGALGQTVASSTLGSFGFASSGIMGGSAAAHWMAASGGIKAGSLYSILQSAGAGGAWAPCVLASSTCGMAVVGGFAYLAMTSIYKKVRG